MTREQIGAALEYKNPNDTIYRIHKCHIKLLDQYSVVDRLSSTDGRTYQTILYSEKGIYTIIRYSDQPKADEFFMYVYEIMEAVRTERITNEVLRGIVSKFRGLQASSML